MPWSRSGKKIPESFLKTHGEILEVTPGVVIEGTFVKNPVKILEELRKKTTAGIQISERAFGGIFEGSSTP